MTYVSSTFPEYRDFPLKDVKEEDGIANAVSKADTILWEREDAYLRSNHLPERIVQNLIRLYEKCIHELKVHTEVVA